MQEIGLQDKESHDSSNETQLNVLFLATDSQKNPILIRPYFVVLDKHLLIK